jgi:glycosyltransferase involved in cell wall biosynthesis
MKKERKKILLVDLGASMGGVEAYLEGLTEILQPRAEIFVICVLEELEKRLQRLGARVIKVPAFSRMRILRFMTALIVFSFLLIRHRISVVQINGFLESILLLPARLLNCESVYTRHGPFEIEIYKWYRQPAKFLPRLASRYCALLASKIVCVSESVGVVCRPMFPVGRVTVIPNWITHFFPYVPKIRLANSSTEIVYVGRLEQYKGVHLLLEALRGMADVTLTVVGDGGHRGTLERLATGIKVTFVGFQNDPRPYYRAADIFVMPSLGPEGLPLVTLEAMAHGLPCVFSDLPVHCEITENGRAAVLFRTGDFEDLRRKLLVLVSSVDARRQYSESAYHAVGSKYHVAAARGPYLRLFELDK